jgi:predicted Zn-dependent protease with MMP-like domain
MERAGDDPADFDALITRALERLPDEFRQSIETVAIVVDDYPTPQQLASTGAYGLFGLYEGVPRTAFGASGAPIASKITLFRGPLEARHRTPEALATAVEETLFHEIAHHLGISDARLRELAAERRRPPRPR